MNTHLGYLIQPVTFLIVAVLFLKLLSALRQKLSQKKASSIVQAESQQSSSRMEHFKHQFAHFRFQEFDFLADVEKKDILWNAIRMAYIAELTLVKGLLRLPAKLLRYSWFRFPYAEVVFPIVILLGYLAFALLGKPAVMVAIIELLNFSVIGMVLLLTVLVGVPIRAFRSVNGSSDFSSQERMQISLSLILIHLSHFVRIWGFFWKIRYFIRWLFVEDSSKDATNDVKQN
jgi:hypothetical protein